jgi:hypothetical protein
MVVFPRVDKLGLFFIIIESGEERGKKENKK